MLYAMCMFTKTITNKLFIIGISVLYTNYIKMYPMGSYILLNSVLLSTY